MMRRRLLNCTLPGLTPPSAWTNVTCRGEMKKDCSYDAYSAVRLPVINQCPPNVGSKE